VIALISGKIVDGDARSLIVDVNGVGYKIFTTAGALESHMKSPGGQTATFWTYLAVRDDALDLYGFTEKSEREMFELLLSVSGVGPKTALGILNAANPATIRKAVASDDPTYLHKTSGISRKNAEKIVLDLKNKFLGSEDAEAAATLDNSDALEALTALGYNRDEARDALKKVAVEATDVAERVREALKLLGKGAGRGKK
jgi:holliday junction DNA helicase RuvA